MRHLVGDKENAYNVCFLEKASTWESRDFGLKSNLTQTHLMVWG